MVLCQVIFLDKLLWMAEDLAHYYINAKKKKEIIVLIHLASVLMMLYLVFEKKEYSIILKS